MGTDPLGELLEAGGDELRAKLDEFALLVTRVGELASELELEGVSTIMAAAYAARAQGVELPPLLQMILG